MGDDSTPPPDADSVEAAGLETAGADAGASGAERRALMRKVAQLTKVVMHLNSKNDESEQQYQLLSEELEEEVTAIVEGAAMEIQAETLKVKDLAEKSSLLANASRLEQLFGQQKLQLAAELRQLHAGAQQLKQRQREMAEMDLEVTIQKVREVSQKLRESLENYRRTLERRALEMAQRHEELRSDRVVELQLFQEDFDRRLEDLKTSLRREAEHARQSTEHAMLHMRRLHEAETSSQQLALLQRRQERMQRLEHDFAEERRAREAARSGMELEMMQQRKDLEDFKASLFSVDQQVEAMRGTLEEMRCRAERASCDADLAHSEAAQAEAETAALAREIALLEVRHRGAAPPAPAVPAVPPAPRAPRPPRNGLTEELREVISNTKQVENEMALVEARLGDLEDELAEQDKTVEILEVETEEERLRTHRLQTRILQLESHLS